MQIVNMHQAKTNLSKVVEAVLKGERVLLAKAGKPVAEIIPFRSDQAASPRIGFMAGRFTVPEDFEALGDDGMETLFRGLR